MTSTPTPAALLPTAPEALTQLSAAIALIALAGKRAGHVTPRFDAAKDATGILISNVSLDAKFKGDKP